MSLVGSQLAHQPSYCVCVLAHMRAHEGADVSACEDQKSTSSPPHTHTHIISFETESVVVSVIRPFDRI